MNSVIVTIASTVITAMIVWYLQDRFRRRGFLFWNTLPRAQFFMPPRPNTDQNHLPVHAETIALQNLGSETLEDVTVVLSYQPMDWQLRITPNRHFEGRLIAENNYSIELGSLGKFEFLTIHVHYYETAPRIVQVRTNEGMVQPSPMFLARIQEPWRIAANLTFQTIGLFTVVLTLLTLLFSVGPLLVDAVSDWIVRTLSEGKT